MNAQNKKRWLLLGVAYVMMAPAGAVAAPDYLKGQTSYKPLENKIEDPYPPGFPEDYVRGGGKLTDEVREKRIRVEANVKKEMDQLRAGEGKYGHTDDERMTPTQLSELVAKAQTGDPKAIGLVGYAYEHGLGTKPSEKQALSWYTRAIEYGETQYYSAVGMMYRDYGAAEEDTGFLGGLKNAITGGDTEKLTDNNQIARQWFEKGVKVNDWNSFLKLGEMYRDGAGGLEVDLEKAQKLYNEGLRLKEYYDKLGLAQIEQNIRVQEELKEGLRTIEMPMSGTQP